MLTEEDVQKTESLNTMEKESSILEKIDDPTYNKNGSVTILEGYTACGFYDLKTNKIIDSGTTIKVLHNTLQGRIHFQQNFPMERTYLLIILIDYVQHPFYVEDQILSSYSFKLFYFSKTLWRTICYNSFTKTAKLLLKGLLFSIPSCSNKNAENPAKMEGFS